MSNLNKVKKILRFEFSIHIWIGRQSFYRPFQGVESYEPACAGCDQRIFLMVVSFIHIISIQLLVSCLIVRLVDCSYCQWARNGKLTITANYSLLNTKIV